jgi:uncharacterized protein
MRSFLTPTWRRSFSLLLVLAVMLTSLPGQVQPAMAISDTIVISQVYGGGGNSGSTYTHDFIELFNRGTTVVDLTGWSVQYASAAGTSWQATTLSGTLQPGQYYLVQQAQGAAGTTPLPTPDATGSIAMSATAGKVALVNNSTALSGSCPSGDHIADFVGYGTTANCFEGSGPTPATSNTTAAIRSEGGCIETDDNAADFATGVPTPRNTNSPIQACSASSNPPLINEFVANHVGTDTHEFIEIFGDPDTDYFSYSILQIEGDTTGAGVIDSVHQAGMTDAQGFWTTGFLTNVLENGTLTLLLVKDFTGVVGNDLDTDNDGVFDVTPWSQVVDDVAVNDGGAGDVTYSTTVLAPGFGGNPFTPGGASRIPDGADTDSIADWVLNDFDGAGLPGFEGTPDPGEAFNTPGAANALVPMEGANVVISQVYGGGGNAGATYTHDFIELFNRGTTVVDLTGWSVQYASATGTTWAVTALSGTLQPGQYYLVQQAQGAAGTTPLPTPDATGSIAMSATNGKVALVNSSNALSGSCPLGAPVVDFVGFGTANCFEGSGPTPALSNTTAALRKAAGAEDTDDNAADFEVGAPTPRNSSFGFPDQAPYVASTIPTNDAVEVAVNTLITITFSELVAVDDGWFAITCSLSGNVTASVAGGPDAFTLNPDTDFLYGETCTVTIYASQVRDVDTDDPPDYMAEDYTFSFSTMAENVCEFPYTPIYEIQGSGTATPLAGQFVATMGVVIGDYEGPAPNLRGFYIQDPTGDGDVTTSDGIFVFNFDNNSVSLGDFVRVTGTAAEFQDQTQIGSVASIINCGTGTIDPVEVTLPFSSPEYLERYEGMLVRLPQTLYVTEHFQLGRFGQVVMSSGGRLQQPTNMVLPGDDAMALQYANDLNRIIIDDHLNNQNPDPILFGRGGLPLSASNTLRGGDTATGIVGVMTYTWAGNVASGNAYRVRPVNALGGGVPDFQPANPRPDSAEAVGGLLKVAGLNLLNYFNTFSGCTLGVGGPITDCRGAENLTEFNRQWPKTVNAILGIDPDVLGVVEIENDGYGPYSAIHDLVTRLNAATAPGTYAFIDVDAETSQVNALGTDAIKVGLIYKPASVTPVGTTAALNTEAFVNAGDTIPRNRPSLAQAFQQNSNQAVFIVDVNHLKSKGSACDIPDDGDGQGNCNVVRTNAANELMSWLASDPTGTGDPDILIIGDLNSYAKEDPIRALADGDYTNLIYSFSGPDAYSYVFDGQWGYLDHALGSASLTSQVTGVTEWHINADEPSVLDYNTNFKTAGQIINLYAPDQFRVSDHDPVIVGLYLYADPLVNANPAWQEVQYSDPITPISVVGEDASYDLPLSASTEWKIEGGDFQTGLPTGLSFTANSCDQNTCSWTLHGNPLVGPGTYLIRFTVNNAWGNESSFTDITIRVTQEDAYATYIGSIFVATTSAASSTATVPLAATIVDIDDGYRGDITNASVTFVNRQSGEVLCSAPVGLVNQADTSVGTAACTWQADLGSSDSLTVHVGVMVNGYYIGESPVEDGLITISRALTGNFITGGGFLLLTNSIGQLPGDFESINSFGFDVKYNKSGRNLQGNFTSLLVSEGRVYQIKSNVLSSLVVNPAPCANATLESPCFAVFTGKANIRDITNPDNPLDVDGNATLMVSITDYGEPGSSDSIAITLFNKNGGLYFSSHWTADGPVEQSLGRGNLVVH